MPRNKSRKTVHLELETDLLEEVDALAEQQERTRVAQIRWMMLRELERCREANRIAQMSPESSAA